MRETLTIMPEGSSAEIATLTSSERGASAEIKNRRRVRFPVNTITTLTDRLNNRNRRQNHMHQQEAAVNSTNEVLHTLDEDQSRYEAQLARRRLEDEDARRNSGYWKSERFDRKKISQYREHLTGDHLVMTDPETGEQVARLAFQRGGQEIREIPEGLSHKQFIESVRAKIEDHEQHITAIAQDPGNIIRLLREVSIYTPPVEDPQESRFAQAKRAITGRPAPKAPPLTMQEQAELYKMKNELSSEIEARLYLALANYSAGVGDKNGYEQALSNWGRDGFEYLAFKLAQEDPLAEKDAQGNSIENHRRFQIQMAIGLMEGTENGAIFRAHNKSETDRLERTIKGGLLESRYGLVAKEMFLRSQNGHPNPLSTDEKASWELSEQKRWLDTTYRLTESFMNVTGMSSYYGGVLDKEGNLLENKIIDKLIAKGNVKGFKEINGKRLIDLTNEEYWLELENYRKENGLKRIPPQYYFRGEDGEKRYVDPDNPNKIYEKGHNNPGLFKGIFASPEATNETFPNHLKDAYKRAIIGSETRVRNLAAKNGFEKMSDYLAEISKNGTVGEMDNTKIGRGELMNWWGLVKGGSEYKEKYMKWLSKPFGGSPNSLNENPSEKNVAEIFAPVTETFDPTTFEYLKKYGDIDARPEIGNLIVNAAENGVKTAFEWHENIDAQKRFRWKPWNSNALSAAVADLTYTYKLISEKSVSSFIKNLSINWFMAGVRNGWLEANEGFKAYYESLKKFGIRVLAESAGNLAA